MSVQAVILLLCILVALGGTFVCAVEKMWIGALAFLVAALYVLGTTWPGLTA